MNPTATIFEELGFDSRSVQLPEGAVVYAIARTYSLIMRKLAATYRRFGLSAPGFNLLLLLKRGKDPDTFTQRRIGEYLVVSPSDMTGLIDRMEQRGLVRRTPGEDRRSKLLQLTPKGADLVERVWPHHAQTIRAMTEAIRGEETQSLLRALNQLRRAMGV